MLLVAPTAASETGGDEEAPSPTSVAARCAELEEERDTLSAQLEVLKASLKDSVVVPRAQVSSGGCRDVYGSGLFICLSCLLWRTEWEGRRGAAIQMWRQWCRVTCTGRPMQGR